MARRTAQSGRLAIGWALLALAGALSGCSISVPLGGQTTVVSFGPAPARPARAEGPREGAGLLQTGAAETRERAETTPADRAAPVPAQAQEGTVGKEAADLSAYLAAPHTAEEYVALALRRHPDIQAAARLVAAEEQTVPQVTALPDPSLNATWWPISDHAPQMVSGRMPFSMGVSQRLPWCGKLQLRGEVAGLQAQIAMTQLASEQLRVAEAVKQSYCEAFFNNQAARTTLESEKLLGLYVKAAEARYRVGQASEQDVLRIQVEQARVRGRLIVYRRELRVAQADLARLLSVPPESDLKPAGALNLPPAPRQIEKLYDLATAQRPELRERLLAITRDDRKAGLAELEYFPDITLGLSWDVMSTGAAMSSIADGKDNFGLTVSMNLPVWRGRLQAGVWEARERTAASAARYSSEFDETLRMVRRLSTQARALEEQIALFRDDIIPKAEQALRVSAADYRVGKVSVLQLLDNWGQLLRFQVQLVRLESSLGQVFASLERTVGSLLTARETPGPAPEKNKK
jgi:outer membrane protein TolC